MTTMNADMKILIAQLKEERDGLETTITVLERRFTETKIPKIYTKKSKKQYTGGKKTTGRLIEYLTKVGESTYEDGAKAIKCSVSSIHNQLLNLEIFERTRIPGTTKKLMSLSAAYKLKVGMNESQEHNSDTSQAIDV